MLIQRGLLLLATTCTRHLVASLAGSSSRTAHDRRFALHVDQATLLTSGTLALPPMGAVPCSGAGGRLTEIVKPPNVDDLYQWYVETRKTPDADPSWGVLWNTAISLSDYLQEHPFLIKNQRVVELGCGLALCGLVSAGLGATSVILSDREPFALHCALSTASVNQQTHNFPAEIVQAAVLDWTDDSSKVAADVVLASDVLYDKETIEAFAGACQRILVGGGGGILLVADPQQERYPGARDIFRAAMEGFCEVETIPLPRIEYDDDSKGDARSVDAMDHARRMREPTVLLKCRISVPS
jgi:predicted nicotinamide N-methyase